jgi:OOP family OmpA-OmpF porin
MKTYLFILLCLVGVTRLSGQDFSNPQVLADKAFRNKNYYEAAYYYKKAVDGLGIKKNISLPSYQLSTPTSKKTTPPDKAYISYMLAESYRLYENYMEAEPWYQIVSKGDLESKYPLVRLWYGVCLRANQNFNEGIAQLQQFVSTYKGDRMYIDKANKEIATCLFAKQQYTSPVMVDVVKMKDSWNSDGSNYSIIKRDQNYWFTSSRLMEDEKKHVNRIYSHTTDNTQRPVLIKFKNDGNKEELEYGTPSLDPTEKRMYLTRWYKKGSKSIYAIYSSDLQNSEWTSPQVLNDNVNIDGFNAIQPFITADGKRLFFVSNKPGGQGGDDIWVSDLDSKGQPINSINLGKTINTSLDEQAPYFDVVKKKLIYSSKGFLGLGGFDFFTSTEVGNTWSEPNNMGYPLNSAKDDLYYYPDKEHDGKVYISSDRQSDCCLELFEVYDKRNILTGLVVDCAGTKGLADVRVSLVDIQSKQTLKKLTVDNTGRYSFILNTDKPYSLVVEKEGYFTKVVPQQTDIKVNKDTLSNADICLQQFAINKPIALSNILYDYGKSTLRPESETVLNKLIITMQDNPKIKIELSSHTDSVGSEVYNQNLSQARAQACVDYVVAKGIPADRIFAKGYGKTKPVAPNTLPDGKDNPDGRQLNRRTEFTVLKIE